MKQKVIENGSKLAKTVHAGGRPSKYKKRYCKEIVEYFDQPFTYTVEKTKRTKDSSYKVDVERVTDLPTFEEFAHKVGVVVATLHVWKQAYPEFLEAYSRAQELQERIIVANAMAGRYVGPFAQFYLKNKHKYQDRQELTGPEGVPLMPVALDAVILTRLKDGTASPVTTADSSEQRKI